MDRRSLVEAARRGDREAFDVLARSTVARLDAAARLILRDDAAARDAVQDAFVRAWRGLRALRDPDRFDTWLHRLLLNACYDEARRRRRRMHVELTEAFSEFAGRIWVDAWDPAAAEPVLVALDDRSLDVVDRLRLGGSIVAFDTTWTAAGESLVRLTEDSVASSR